MDGAGERRLPLQRRSEEVREIRGQPEASVPAARGGRGEEAVSTVDCACERKIGFSNWESVSERKRLNSVEENVVTC